MVVMVLRELPILEWKSMGSQTRLANGRNRNCPVLVLAITGKNDL